MSALQEAGPNAEMLLIGTTDGFANIHAPNERVLIDEFEKAVAAPRRSSSDASLRSREATRDDRRAAGRRRTSTRSSSGCSTGSSVPATRCRDPAILFLVLCGGR